MSCCLKSRNLSTALSEDLTVLVNVFFVIVIPAEIGLQPMDSVSGVNITIPHIDCQICVILSILRCILGVSILINFVDKMLFIVFLNIPLQDGCSQDVSFSQQRYLKIIWLRLVVVKAGSRDRD